VNWNEAGAASRASAAITDALRRVEVERGHDDRAPKVELEWVAVQPGRLCVQMRNQTWRGYRATKILVINGGEQEVGISDDLPSRGTAIFWPTPMHPGSKAQQQVKDQVARLVANAIVQITWSTDGLWRCECGRDERAHWVERRQLPVPPQRNEDYGPP
jgi:hypothetical protein